MRLIKAQNTNLRSITGKGIKYTIDNEVIFDTSKSLLIAKGTTAERPSNPTAGVMRFNTDLNEFEFYQDAAWRKVSYKQPSDAGIYHQDLGVGDNTKYVFGPVLSNDADYPVPVNEFSIVVYVDNIFQIPNTNFELQTNPVTGIGEEIPITQIIPGETYYIFDNTNADFIGEFGTSSNTIGTEFTPLTVGTGPGIVKKSGKYLFFGSPVDTGIKVTAIHNMDK